jgi:hypothetical protein
MRQFRFESSHLFFFFSKQSRSTAQPRPAARSLELFKTKVLPRFED